MRETRPRRGFDAVNATTRELRFELLCSNATEERRGEGLDGRMTTRGGASRSTRLGTDGSEGTGPRSDGERRR